MWLVSRDALFTLAVIIMDPMRKFLLFALLILVAGCTQKTDKAASEKQINQVLDAWHAAAAKADFNGYFGYLSEESIFMGTDATEHWDKKEFMEFAKPYFDRGRAWDFKALERHIFFDPSGSVAWFDELLDTQMKICRGSGVLRQYNGNWKIDQYVLSVTIPNDLVDSIVSIKGPVEDVLIRELKQTK
jgi:hypothetical protein